MSFDVTALPENMREKIMPSLDGKLTNGSECWEWQGCVNSKGYGCTAGGRKGYNVLTHRKAYQTLVGAIPAGLTIDHLCMNKVCVNTDHMEVVTRAENSRRKNAAQTHCKHGHPLSGENLYLKHRRSGRVDRVCLTCHRKWQREMKAKRAASAST